jgi:hypothetical protein
MVKTISQDVIHSRFYYDSGFLYYKESFSKSKAGRKAGTLNRNDGYLYVNINYKLYPLHRIIYIYFNDDFDANMFIDHINSIKTDNRIENLRLADKHLNERNCKYAKGYVFEKSRNKFKVTLTINGCSKFIGRYTTEHEARVAYINAKKIYHNININTGELV